MFMIIWEYIVAESHEAEFERIYGAAGDWEQLFKKDWGYLGTELLRDINYPRHYITIDRWISSSSYESFLEQYRAEYDAIDTRCDYLTEHETRIGGSNLLFFHLVERTISSDLFLT